MTHQSLSCFSGAVPPSWFHILTRPVALIKGLLHFPFQLVAHEVHEIGKPPCAESSGSA